MRITLRQLTAFKSIVEKGNFNKAAQYLDLTQPTLSATLKSLEKELGMPVLDRTTRSIRLTPAGQELYSHLSTIFERLQKAVTSTQDVAAGRGGSVSICYIDFAMLGNLPKILARFRKVNPKVQVEIAFTSSSEQIEQVYKGRLDLGFILQNNTPLPKGVISKPISRESLVTVLPQDHKFASRETLDLVELANEEFVMGDPMWFGYNELVMNLCIRRGFRPRIRQSAHLREELLSFVMAGLGILIYPSCIINTSRFGLKAIPIRDVGKVITTSAIWLKHSSNPVLPSLLAQIGETN